MMKKLPILFLFALASMGVIAQTPVTPATPPSPPQVTPPAIKFDETTHDFGTLNQGEPAEFLFKWSNVSNAPVQLTGVKASCGCTTPKWTKETVAPNGSGEIAVSYNSQRVGPFNKSVTVTYDSLAAPIIIYIKGDVKAKEAVGLPGQEGAPDVNKIPTGGSTSAPPVPEAPKPDVYNTPRGALYFENLIQYAGEVSSDKTADVVFKFKNKSDKPVSILDKYEADAEVTVKPAHKVIAPGQESSITVTMSGAKMKELNKTPGSFSTRIGITTNEATDALKYMTVNGTFTRILSAEEKANSPTIKFETVEVNGGKIIEGEQFEYKFKFTNTGKSDLIITSAKASCGCTATKPPVDAIKPGESDFITATFNSTGRVGSNTKTIAVTSNDANNPNVTLKFTVEVEKDPFHAGGLMSGEEHGHDDHEGHSH